MAAAQKFSAFGSTQPHSPGRILSLDRPESPTVRSNPISSPRCLKHPYTATKLAATLKLMGAARAL